MMDETRIGENTQVQAEDQINEATIVNETPANENAATEDQVAEETTDQATQGSVEPVVTEEAAEVPVVETEDEKEAETLDTVTAILEETEETEGQVPSTDIVAEETAPEEAAAVEELEEETPEDEMTMEELMRKYDNPVKMGQIIKGKVIQLDDKEAIIAIVGAGNDGKLSIDEVSFDDSAKLTDLMKLGEEVEAKIIRRPIENDSFYILSVKEVEREASKDELLAVLGKDETISARVKEAVKGGLVAFYKGHRIFIPASHVEINSVRDLKLYVGEDIDINIIEAEERRGSTRIVASRKKHLLKEKQAMEGQTWEELELNQVEEGRVERLTDFGAFINVKGVDGLLHISEITHGKIPKPSSVLKVGDMVMVKIISVDKENKKLSLSMKALQEDPWKNIAEKYPNESIVLGKIVRFTDFGAFIELEPGVDGLAHISQLSHSRVEKPSDVLTIGETIKVMVLDSSEKDKKVSLSVKAVE